MKIIKYDPKYEKDVEQVFLWAGSKRTRTTDGVRECMHATFCDYYIKKESESCFIAINEEDKAIGYILCAKVYDPEKIEQYIEEKNMNGLKEWMHSCMELYPSYKGKYDAHLHINVLPEYQWDGIGSALMETLLSYLEQEKVNGVMLGVASQNEKGNNFYRKWNFKLLEANEHVNIMGKKVGRKDV